MPHLVDGNYSNQHEQNYSCHTANAPPRQYTNSRHMSSPCSSMVRSTLSSNGAPRNCPANRYDEVDQLRYSQSFYEQAAYQGHPVIQFSHATSTPNVSASFAIAPLEAAAIRDQRPDIWMQKKKRKRATEDQLEILNGSFKRSRYPPTAERDALAARLGMTSRSVQIWFQNKRQQLRQRAKDSSPYSTAARPPPSRYSDELSHSSSEYGTPVQTHTPLDPATTRGVRVPIESHYYQILA